MRKIIFVGLALSLSACSQGITPSDLICLTDAAKAAVAVTTQADTKANIINGGVALATVAASDPTCAALIAKLNVAPTVPVAAPVVPATVTVAPAAPAK